jgi:hypothetical protein
MLKFAIFLSISYFVQTSSSDVKEKHHQYTEEFSGKEQAHLKQKLTPC